MAKHNYIKSAWLVSISTLGSRILGLIRDISMASIFGAGTVFDAFVMAFTFPNLFRRFFGEGAISSAFIPVFSNVLECKGRKDALTLANKIVTCLSLILFCLLSIGIAACFFFKFIPDLSFKNNLLLNLTILMMPYLLLICLTAFLSSVLNSLHHFLCPALAPIFLNIFWLMGIFIIAPIFGTTQIAWIYAIGVSILIGGFFQLGLQVPPLYKYSMIIKPDFHFIDPLVFKVLKNLGPVMVGAAVIQINVLLDRLIAWFMIPENGALTVLYMGNRLMQFPLAIIGISLATVVFPMFSKYVAQKNLKQLSTAIPGALRTSFFLALPASVGLAMLAKPVIILICQYNRFTNADALRTSNVLIAYCSGLWVYILIQLITKAFYSMSDTKTPTKLAFLAMLSNLILNLLFVPFLKETGLALATSLNAFFHCAVLLYLLQKKMPLCWGNIGSFLVKSVLSTIAMALVVFLISFYFPPGKKVLQRVISVAIPVIAGIFVYILSSFILRNQELKHLFCKV